MSSHEHHHYAFHRDAPERPPGFWLGAAILASMFCCPPVGVVGIVYAALALGARDVGDERRKVRLARLWTQWSVGVGVLWTIALCLIGNSVNG